MPFKNGLDLIKSIDVVSYLYKQDSDDYDRKKRERVWRLLLNIYTNNYVQRKRSSNESVFHKGY